MFCGIHLRATSEDMLMLLIHNMCLKITFLKNTTTSLIGDQWVYTLMNYQGLEGFINAVNSTDFNPCMFDKNMFSTSVQ